LYRGCLKSIPNQYSYPTSDTAMQFHSEVLDYFFRPFLLLSDMEPYPYSIVKVNSYNLCSIEFFFIIRFGLENGKSNVNPTS